MSKTRAERRRETKVDKMTETNKVPAKPKTLPELTVTELKAALFDIGQDTVRLRRAGEEIAKELQKRGK